MGKTITQKQLKEYRKAFSGDPSAKMAQNAVANNDLLDVALDRDMVQDTDFSFSIKLDDWKVTNQMRSGRCWLFATLNLFRPGTMKKLNVKNFEFSQAHIHFWDKFERANHFYEAIIDTADRPVDDRTIGFLLGDPIGDGGQWNMAMNLIRKHGLVPKVAYPESKSSSSTRWMNAILKDLLRSGASEIREILDNGGTVKQAREHKDSRMSDVWRVLCIHLGTPPEKFDWQWEDKDGEFNRRGSITPQEFASEYVDMDWEDFVCIVNDPRNKYYQRYTVDFLQNVAGGPPVIYLNVPSSEMKAITQKLLEDGNPVWMGCDVGKQMHRQRGLWDANLFDFAALYGSEFGMDKANRLRFGQTMMTHAMLFTGVDVVNGKPRRWRVENSWGEKESGKKGFYTMNDSWYDEYMFEIACPSDYLSDKMKAGLDSEPIVLPAWDPMGSLAHDEALA
ncbi:MAG: C1 family peptidase [Candidatus Thalassarchaeaceae archaeon]|jgi:bleomycin hydrolase|nr:C1 family peptidase [Candidatus Thalassarchaeaceae archaeon]DAC36594.1 MAG TPA: aminopeptidase [Candidatus Poseidoniales archaeon]MDP6318565.1 C1 family peptidase [Candidatus Thalassarchaeaceae archaeon]HIH79732.1 C1 family peptidase [Candidatus Thalassarchaeaceae archaeon]HJM30394.1 C1 family peptidase [Candidatus Thalassarchaeaceae archaeon]|tara:strand:- start:616 stop:1962 length:1347 start_codon:yes stop_codon:yes gene_type:complete